MEWQGYRSPVIFFEKRKSKSKSFTAKDAEDAEEIKGIQGENEQRVEAYVAAFFLRFFVLSLCPLCSLW